MQAITSAEFNKKSFSLAACHGQRKDLLQELGARFSYGAQDWRHIIAFDRPCDKGKEFQKSFSLPNERLNSEGLALKVLSDGVDVFHIDHVVCTCSTTER